jgi:hypothetical protein
MPGIQDTGRSLPQEATRTAEAFRIALPARKSRFSMNSQLIDIAK